MNFMRTSFLRGLAPYAFAAAVLVVGAMKPVAQRSRLTAEATIGTPVCGSLTWNSPQCRSYQQAVAMQNTLGWGALSPFYNQPYFPSRGVATAHQTGPVPPYFIAPSQAYNWPSAYGPSFGSAYGNWAQPTVGWGSAAF